LRFADKATVNLLLLKKHHDAPKKIEIHFLRNTFFLELNGSIPSAAVGVGHKLSRGEGIAVGLDSRLGEVATGSGDIKIGSAVRGIVTSNGGRVQSARERFTDVRRAHFLFGKKEERIQRLAPDTCNHNSSLGLGRRVLLGLVPRLLLPLALVVHVDPQLPDLSEGLESLHLLGDLLGFLSQLPLGLLDQVLARVLLLSIGRLEAVSG